MRDQTVSELRTTFARSASHSLAKQVGRDFEVIPDHGNWTKLAVWYERVGELLAVVGEHEMSAVDLVLAHGLFHANGRMLTLLLPEGWAFPTRFRQPWITDTVNVWTHAGGTASFAPPLTKAATHLAMRGHPTDRPHRLPPEAAEWVRRLTEWATGEPGLTDAHTSTVRGWSHDGQRVLAIGGKRTIEIKAGIDAAKFPALSLKLTGPLTSEQFDAVTARVKAGIGDASSKAYGRFEEHHLQVRLRQYPGSLLLEQPLLREVPAWRPAGGMAGRGRGFVDLVGLDSAGDIVLVETKLGQDAMLVLQGLDYWIWATEETNQAWLRERLYAAEDAKIRLLYAVAGKKAATPKLGRYESSHLELLDPEIPWRVALLADWDQDHHPPVLRMSEQRTRPA